MKIVQIAGILLIVAGAAALAFDSFSYTKSTDQAAIGPIKVEVQQQETVFVPWWAAGLAILAGAGLLLAGRRTA